VADRANPPPLGGVVFIGSSSIQAWSNMAADFPGVPVLNRGFGGSTLADVVYYADRILLPYRPRLVVLYAGDNDLALGRTPERVLGDYRAFVARLRAAWPGALVAFVAIKPSPARRIYIDRMRETNQLIQAEIARDSLQVYVDVFTPMLDASGQPRPELFVRARACGGCRPRAPCAGRALSPASDDLRERPQARWLDHLVSELSETAPAAPARH